MNNSVTMVVGPCGAVYVSTRASVQYRRKLVITGRTARNEAVTVTQIPGHCWLPWCEDEVFLDWLKLLSGEHPCRVHAQWFVLCSPYTTDPLQLNDIFYSLHRIEPCFLKISWIADELSISPQKLHDIFVRSFGVSPGAFLRAFDLFNITVELMNSEALLQAKSRRGCSPLASRGDDYRRRLKRLLGITYSELRTLARMEHWVSIWMRHWRHRVCNSEG